MWKKSRGLNIWWTVFFFFLNIFVICSLTVSPSVLFLSHSNRLVQVLVERLYSLLVILRHTFLLTIWREQCPHCPGLLTAGFVSHLYSLDSTPNVISFYQTLLSRANYSSECIHFHTDPYTQFYMGMKPTPLALQTPCSTDWSTRAVFWTTLPDSSRFDIWFWSRTHEAVQSHPSHRSLGYVQAQSQKVLVWYVNWLYFCMNWLEY